MAKNFPVRIIGYISGTLIYLSVGFQVDQLTWNDIQRQFKPINSSFDFMQAIINVEVKYNIGDPTMSMECLPSYSEKLKQIEELWITSLEGKLRLVSRYGKTISQCLMECVGKFGLESRIERAFKESKPYEIVSIKTWSINGHLVEWFAIGGYDSDGNLLVRHKPTEPIMLCSSRPDITAAKCLKLVDMINKIVGVKILNIRDCILPEDWEEIAGVKEAQKDIRYALG